MRKNKHGRVGAKRRLSNPQQPTTLIEARQLGFKEGHDAGRINGYAEAVRDIGNQLMKRKLSAANMRKWFAEHYAAD